jgi:multiple sugar transport system permease protein
MHSTKRRPIVTTVVTYVALAILVFVALFPFYWMGLTSLRSPRGVYVREAMLIPRDLTLENFEFVFSERPTATWLRNSLFVAFISSSLSIIIGVLAGYSLARLRYLGNRTMARTILFTYLMPSTLIFIPLFILMSNLNLINSFWALFLSYQTFNVPFCTWLILGYFRTIPIELEDAARIDGCDRLGVLWRIIVPLAAPGIVTAFIFGFTNSWNEFLFATVLTNSATMQTLPSGLGSFIMGDVFLWGPLMAVSLVTTLPPIVLFIIVQRYVVSGMTLGSVKG